MPITIPVASHPATSWVAKTKPSAEDLLAGVSRLDHKRCMRIIHSSFSAEGNIQNHHVSASKNGLVWAAYQAYSHHHHLTIRPEDIWFAIISQISFYINKNPESLRNRFVSSRDRKELAVTIPKSTKRPTYHVLAQLMNEEIVKNVEDPSLVDWILPSFSTTTGTDRVIASILFMRPTQKCVTQRQRLWCGIPSVTLLGKVKDYKQILNRLDKLEEMGAEPCRFAEMLRPILQHLILSFNEPKSCEVRKFWESIVDIDRSSGATRITGWITAFCYWYRSDQGEICTNQDDVSRWPRRTNIFVHGVSFLKVELWDIPAGFAAVPVRMTDVYRTYSCTMLAGSMGIQGIPGSEFDDFINSDGKLEIAEKPSHDEGVGPTLTGIRPLTGWIIVEDKPEGT
ncbi:hypothetical protein FHETE_7178 [Fusarium heterosporum]|uniref:Uncharacterized protein n=1 Tax=Fusarium heterosporum TaxID=42747 RepID=A0A8H5WMP5_FUSHE|nr:hypothetical protein FHETE_7178 [Fusarium heterosporum]